VIEWQSDHPDLFAPAIFLYRICFSQVFTQVISKMQATLNSLAA